MFCTGSPQLTSAEYLFKVLQYCFLILKCCLFILTAIQTFMEINIINFKENWCWKVTFFSKKEFTTTTHIQLFQQH